MSKAIGRKTCQSSATIQFKSTFHPNAGYWKILTDSWRRRKTCRSARNANRCKRNSVVCRNWEGTSPAGIPIRIVGDRAGIDSRDESSGRDDQGKKSKDSRESHCNW